MTGRKACATSSSAAPEKPSSRPSTSTPTNSRWMPNGRSDERSREEPRTELMRASVLRDGRMVLREDVAEPVPGPGQVLVGVKACGICGSDLHFAKHGADVLELNNQIGGFGGAMMQIDLNRDVFMGHEFSAEVLEAGPDTEAPAPGTLVTSLPVLDRKSTRLNSSHR